MHRRTLLLSALAGGASLALARGATAADATPTPTGAVPPLRWELQQIASNNRTLTPDDPANYWIQLLPDGTVWLKADCNQGSGSYTLDGSTLSFGEFVTTRVACAEGSIADEFVRNLGYVAAYQIAGDLNDELVLEMMADGGTLTFRPALTGVVWEWVRFEGGDGSVIAANDPTRYTLAFLDDGTVEVRADCNRGSGTAEIDGPSISITAQITLMGCPEGSQDSDFLRILSEPVTYVIQDGMLHLSLPVDSGIATFRPAAPETGTATPEAAP
jgi:heat shock protein HslJ